MSRPGWDEYFLGICEAVAARADCTRRQVGAVIVDADHRIIATGYNGSAPGGASCLAGECPRGTRTYEEQPGLVGDYSDCHAVHAELNAIIFARASCKGATIYVTDPPCSGCVKAISGAGISRVVWTSVQKGLHEEPMSSV